MYPTKIRTYKKEFNEFKLYKEIKYTQFDYSFNGDDFEVNLELLISKNCNLVKFNSKTKRNQFNDLNSDWINRNSTNIAKGGKGGKGGDKDGNGQDGEDGEWSGKGGKGGSSGLDLQMILIICGLSLALAILFIVILILKCRNRILNNKSKHLISYKS